MPGEPLITIAAVIGAVAAIITGCGIIWARVVAPIIARPVARAVRHELAEFVEVVFVDSGVVHDHIAEVAGEAVAANLAPVTELLHDHESRLERIERDTRWLRRHMPSSSGPGAR